MSSGKGDSPRKVDGDKYRSNYDKIFRKPSEKIRWSASTMPLGTMKVTEETESICKMEDEFGNRVVIDMRWLDKIKF